MSRRIPLLLEAQFMEPQTPADKAKWKASNRDQEAEPHRTLHVELHIPPADRQEKEARRKKKKRFQCVRLGVEIITLLAVLGYATVNYWLYQQTAISAEAAKKSADAVAAQVAIMRTQLEASQRPAMNIESLTLESGVFSFGFTYNAPESTEAEERSTKAIDFSGTNIGAGAASQIRTIMFWATVKALREVEDLEPDPRQLVFAASLPQQTVAAGKPFTGGKALVPGRAWDEVQATGYGAVSIYGWFEYRDSLNTKRREPFCWNSVLYPVIGFSSERCLTLPKSLGGEPIPCEPQSE